MYTKMHLEKQSDRVVMTGEKKQTFSSAQNVMRQHIVQSRMYVFDTLPFFLIFFFQEPTSGNWKGYFNKKYPKANVFFKEI